MTHNDIPNIISNFKVKPRAQKQDDILSDAIELQRERSKKLPGDNIWKLIMKHNITKLATAAVILITLLIALNQNGVAPDGATIAWADIIKSIDNMADAVWIHTRNTSSTEEENKESWLSLSQKMLAEKDHNGNLTYTNQNANIKYKYNPSDNTITISNALSSSNAMLDMPEDPIEFTRYFVKLLKSMLDPDKYYVETSSKSKDNNIVECTYEITPIDESKTLTKYGSMQISIDEKAKLLSKIKIYADNADSIVDLNMTFDYPATGPADIYELGAPADANVIDNSSSQLLVILDSYQKARNSFPDNRVTIIEENGRLSDNLCKFTMVYSNGSNKRYDSITFDVPPYSIKGIVDNRPEIYNSEYFNTFRAEIAKNNYYIKRIQIYSETYNYDIDFDFDAGNVFNGTWEIERSRGYADVPGVAHSHWLSLISRAWPSGLFSEEQHRTKLSIISDSYSQKYNLVCIESLENGWTYNGELSRLPHRTLYYLDPEKDYLCHRLVHQNIRNAYWHTEKNWLKGIKDDPNEKDRQTITQILKYNQTSNGQWYPIEMESRHEIDDYDCNIEYELKPDKFITIIENPTIDDSLFDPQYIMKDNQ